MIQIQELSKETKNYKYKILFSFILFSALMLVSATLVHIYFTKQNIKDEFIYQSQLQVKDKAIYLESFIQKRVDTVNAVKKNPYFAQFIDYKNYEHNTNFLFFTILEENKDFMQLRYIDEYGDEKLRFDRERSGSVGYKTAYLQNKKDRYYFKKTKQLKEDQVFISQIDFNIENNKVQKPYVPVVRISTPIYRDDKFKGILIANIFIDDFIKQWTSSPIFDITLINQQNKIIYKNNKYNHNDLFGNNIQHILDESLINDGKKYIKKLQIHNFVIYICLEKKKKFKQQMMTNNIYMSMIILLITFVLAMVFVYIVSKPINRIFKIAIDKSEQLYKLANELDQKVDEEVKKNQKKDTMIQHQEKMAGLGDMISNIAHQWRQPITRVSLIVQNLKLLKKQNMLKDKQFYDSLAIAQDQIEFISNTIDDFREFYKSNQKKEKFSIAESFKKILKIVEPMIKNSNIQIEINDKDSIKIYGNQNLFMQAILTIISNAKDALVQNKPKNPKISINIYKKDDKIMIDIKNNGKGIEKNIVKNIFEPYFSTKGDKGTGTGLYLCKNIIYDSFAGKVVLENALNSATFKIILDKPPQA